MDQTMCAADIVSGLTRDQVTTRGHQRVFLNYLRQAVAAIERRQPRIRKAIRKLNQAIRRTDGCEANGSPDGKGSGRDWITDCDAQAETLSCLRGALEALGGER